MTTRSSSSSAPAVRLSTSFSPNHYLPSIMSLRLPVTVISSSPIPALRRAYHGPQRSLRAHLEQRAALSRQPIALARTATSSNGGRKSDDARQSWTRYAAVGVGAVGLSALWASSSKNGRSQVWCQPTTPPPPPPAPESPARSTINPQELGFGAVCGICSGIFIKKGLKALAFALGGIFVLLQYLSSLDLLKVNWTKAASTYDRLTSTQDEDGKSVGLTVTRAWGWMIDFLSRDFQQRATFLGGLALGFRLG